MWIGWNTMKKHIALMCRYYMFIVCRGNCQFFIKRTRIQFFFVLFSKDFLLMNLKRSKLKRYAERLNVIYSVACGASGKSKDSMCRLNGIAEECHLEREHIRMKRKRKVLKVKARSYRTIKSSIFGRHFVAMEKRKGLQYLLKFTNINTIREKSRIRKIESALKPSISVKKGSQQT